LHGDSAAQNGVVPAGDLRRRQPDHPHAQRVAGTGAVDRVKRHDHPWWQCMAMRAGDVARNNGKIGIGKCPVERRQPVVEFMVAQRRGIIAQCIHRRDHRVGAGVVDHRGVGEKIAHRGALQEIAVVQEQAIGDLAARRADHRRQPRQPVLRLGGGGAVGEIVIAENAHVQIGGLQDAQAKRGGLLCHDWSAPSHG
jgi:hypothetical protein